MQNAQNVIQITDLCKSFGDIKAVNNLSFSVRKGQLFAFLGVNGAGKSTTISIISGQLKKDGGSVLICGKDIDCGMGEIAARLGVVFQNSVLDRALSVRDNLKCRAALYGISGNEFKARLDELSQILDFKDLLSRPVGKLSGGQRRRIDIARALFHKPQILILDEPTTGLDPQTRRLIWQTVSELQKREGMTVFLTTHYMEEAADADYVVILDSGKISAKGTPLELKNKYTGDFITIYNPDTEKIEKLGLRHEAVPGGVRLFVNSTAQATELIINNPELFTDYEIKKGDMDDVFLNVTGKKLTGGSENDGVL